jgi:hypothetical protein
VNYFFLKEASMKAKTHATTSAQISNATTRKAPSRIPHHPPRTDVLDLRRVTCCPFCDGTGVIGVDIAALTQSRPEGAIEFLPGGAQPQVFVFGADGLAGRPCPHLMSIWGDLCQGIENFTTPQRSDHFTWDALAVTAAGLIRGSNDRHYLEVVFNQVDVGLRPNVPYHAFEFSERWESRAFPAAPAQTSEVTGAAIFVRDPVAFFNELAAQQKVYQRHLAAIQQMREPLNG